MDSFDADGIEELLQATGELLAIEGEEAAIVVVGGATLNVRRLVERVTKDVDVIALAERTEGGWRLVSAHPLPQGLIDAASTVARDYGVASDWLNAVIGAQWAQGLPPSLPTDVEWRQYGSLYVGYAGRSALIALKLFAAVDQSPTSVHFQDLVALGASAEELNEAKDWVLGQDASASFPALLSQVLEHLGDRR